MASQRILLIGLDSASWTLLDPWINAGLLPHLAALRGRSVWGELESTIHPITSSAWVTLLTGKNPGQHGVYDFVRRRAGSYTLEMTNATTIQSSTLYDWLSAANKRVASINMPYTFPPRPLNGKLIGGLFAPTIGPALTYPSSLWDEVCQVAPRYCIAPDYKAQNNDPLGTYLADMHDSVEQRTLTAEWLLSQEEWDLFTVVFTETDETQHAFWHCLPGASVPAQLQDQPARYGDAILGLYQHIDASLGRLLKLAGNMQVWIASDHGAGPFRYWINLNRWLANEGLLTLAPTRGPSTPIIHSLARSYKRYVPDRMRRKVRSVIGQKFETVKAHLQTKMFADAISWPETKVYALGTWGSLYINLKGREPEGIVSPGAEYEALRDQVIQTLEQLVNPATGERPVAKVYRREELYHGESCEQAPDLIITWNDPSYCGRGSSGATAEDIFQAASTTDLSELPLTGTHDYQGMFMLSPSSDYPMQSGARAHIQDIAPSILHAMGVPIPADLDGRVLPYVGAEDPSVRVEATAFVGPASYDLSDEETALVEKRLSDLGYL